MANLTHGSTAWTGTQTQAAQQKTYTFATADKYVDKNIALTVKAQDGTATLSGGALTHGEITTTDTTYLTGTSTNGYAVTFSNSASVGAVTATVSKAGWIDDGDIAGIAAGSTDTKTLTKYVKKGSASVAANQTIPVTGSITNNNGVLTADLSGSKSVTGSATAGWVTAVTAATVSASGTATADAKDLDENLVAGNIVPGKTIFGVTGDGTNAKAAQFTNAPVSGETYVEIPDGPILIEGDYLYVSDGWVTPADTSGIKIPLARLVPNNATISASSGTDKLLKDEVAYDNDGEKIIGTMGIATVVPGAVSVTSASIGAKSGSNYKINVTVDAAAPTLSGITAGQSGAYVYNNADSLPDPAAQTISTATLPAATASISGGALTAGAGAVDAVASTGLTLKETGDTGDYSITVTGSGTVNRAAATASSNKLGIVPSGTIATLAADSLSSNEATKTVYITKGSVSKTTVTPSQSQQTVTVSAGYYDAAQTITIKAADSSAIVSGAISADDSAISSVSATAGTASLNQTTWKYTVPLTLSASGTAYAKVTTNGYVDTEDNTSKALTGSGSASVVLDAYDGTFTVA